ncbi:EcsC family protein [Sporolactobacillus shoreicorticis]|uniref:EcsC family protein n=1 Tax=Sporolactobacillus shoreicorticis TaxID=1923877 RepID=A0ABW5S8X6_9BACL|nr:EcsC family protein [Sporolactobacillus shoreicorticis]MCO7126057.1 EcsC family protein [Sporolactobacillus shoreicorticis]
MKIGLLTSDKVMTVLDWCYEQSLNGLPAMPSVSEIAERYLDKHHQNPEAAIKAFVRWQHAKVGTTGFLTGLGGLITLPVAVPADVSSVLYVQTRMIAVIASIRDYDLNDDQVKTFVYACLVGQSGVDLLKNAGVKIGQKLTVQMIKQIPKQVLLAINKKVGLRLVTKFGQKGVVNLGKLVPVVGGVIGGTVNMGSNLVIAKTAKKVFI